MAKKEGKVRRQMKKAKSKVRKAMKNLRKLKHATLSKQRNWNRVLQKRKNIKARGIKKRLAKSVKKAA